MSKCFIIGIFIIICFISSTESMPKIGSRRRPNVPRECTASYCNLEGTCHLDQLGYARCSCYIQYYSGTTCHDISSSCVNSPRACITYNTIDCWDYFGNHDCICKNWYYGRRCQHYGLAISYASFLGIYFRRQPATGTETPLYVSYFNRERTNKMDIEVTGFSYTLYPENFTEMDANDFKQFLFDQLVFRSSTSKSSIIIPQRYVAQTSHYFLHAGGGFVVCTQHMLVVHREPLYAPIGWAEEGAYMATGYGISAAKYGASVGKSIVGTTLGVATSAVDTAVSVASGIFSYGKSWLPSTIGDWVQWGADTAIDYGNSTYESAKDYAIDVANSTYQGAKETAFDVAYGVKPVAKDYYNTFQNVMEAGDSYLSYIPVVGGYLSSEGVFATTGFYIDKGIDTAEGLFDDAFDYAKDIYNKDENDRTWAQIIAPNDAGEEAIEISYTYTHKIYTIKVSDKWYFQYEATPNTSLCCPDVRFRGGVCSIYSNLPTTILSKKQYRLDTTVINSCGKASTFSDMTFKNIRLTGDGPTVSMQTIESDGRDTPVIFTMTTFDSDLFNGWRYELYGEIGEEEELTRKNISTRGKGFGRDMCWMQYHFRIEPVVAVDCGTQIAINVDDHPTVHSIIYFIDEPTKEIEDNMDGKLSYTWQCYKSRYGWIYMHGCDMWFTSYEKDKYLNFWWTVEGDVKLTVCFEVDYRKYNLDQRYYCDYTVFHVIAYYGIIDVWNLPVFFLSCLQNCGEGTETAYSQVDRGEITSMKVTCVARCELTERFMWHFNDVEKDDFDSNTFFWDSTESENRKQSEEKLWNYKMIRPYAFSVREKVVVVHVIGSYEKEYGWAAFTIKFWIAPSHQSISPQNCQSNPTYKGTAFYTDFYLCIQNVHSNETLTFMYYQQVAEFEQPIGCMVGYSQAPYISGVILASSTGLSKINIIVVNDVFGSEYLDSYHPIEVYPPEERSQGPIQLMLLLENVYDGVAVKNIQKSSCELDSRLNQISAFTQKMHFIVIEMAHIGLSRNVGDQIAVEMRKKDLITDAISLMQKLKVTLPIDAIQLTTLLYELIYINPIPLNHLIANGASLVLETFSTTFKELIENDPNYRLKPYRVLRIIRPIVDAVSAIIFPATEILIGINDDPMTMYVQSNTKDDIHVSDEDEKLIPENYPSYTGDEVFQADKLSNYGNATIRATALLAELTRALIVCLYPSGRDLSIYWPALEMYPQGKSNMYFFVKYDVPYYFVRYYYQIGLPKLVLIDFPANFSAELGSDPISVQVVITDSMPYWWKNTSSIYLPSMIFVKAMNTNNETLTANVDFRFAVTDDSFSFQAAEAHKYVPTTSDESGITCHIAYIHADIPRQITVTFNKHLQGNLKVLIRTEKCPTPTQFNTYGKTTLVGSNVKEGSYNYVVDFNLPKKKRALFVFVGVVARDREVVEYQIKFNAISCGTWKTFVEKSKYDWEEECDHTRLTEAGSYVQCSCQLSNDSNSFAGSNLPLMHRVYGWMAIGIDYRLNPYQLTIVTAMGFLFFMAFIFFIASVLDAHDEKQQRALYLVDNRPFERYMYIVCVCTGSSSSHRTTAHIGIKVYGSMKNSKRHVLVGVHDTPVLKARGVDFFGMTTESNLGKIRAVELWSDHRGTSPAWFCEKVIIRDYKAMLEWVFMVRKWFSLIEGDEKIHRILYQTKKTTPSFWGRVFQPDDMFIHHVWFGMFSREHCHSFSRRIKVVMAFSIINTAFFMGLFLYGVTEFQEDALYDEGHTHMDQVVYNGVLALLISVCVNYPIMYIFKNCQADPNFNYYYYDFSGIDPTVPIPLYPLSYYQRYMAWALVSLLTITSEVFIFWVGPSFGIRKSIMLVGSFFVALVFDIVLIETFHVILRSLIWRGIYRNKDTQRFCNQVIDINCDSDVGLANNQNKTLLLKKDMLLPMRGSIARALQVRERYFFLYSNLLKEFTLYILFIIFLYTLMMSYRDFYAYYSSQIMRDIVVDTRFTGTQSLKNISSIDELFRFINYTVILSLHWQSPCWLPTANLRLIGVARIRQIRNIPELDKCAVPQEVEKMIPSCISDLDSNLVDTSDYNPIWKPYNETIRFHPRIAIAFKHQSQASAEAYGLYTVNSYIPGGGYTAYLGRSIGNSRNVLNYLRFFNWFDDHTRVLIIEFTAFNVNTNLFNCVQLVIERSITGDFITSEYITSLVLERRHFISGALEYFFYGVLIVLLGIIIMIEIESFFSPKIIGGEAQVFWFILDLVNLGLALACVCLFVERAILQHGIIDAIDTSRNNSMLMFGRQAYVDFMCRLIGSILVVFTTLRIWKLLRFNSQFLIVEYTIKFAFTPLVSLTVVLLLLCLMASLILYLLFGTRFMIWWNFYKIPAHIDFYYEGQLAFIAFFCLFTFLMKNFFIAVIMVSYRKSREVMKGKMNRFTFGVYLQERVLGFDKSELIRWGLTEAELNKT